MSTAAIIVADIIGPNLDHDDGRAVYAAIHAALAAGQDVRLDFKGLDIITPSFLNTSFRILAKQYGPDVLKNRLTIVNTDRLMNTMIRDATSA
jgi:hypothetical protein